MKKSSILAGLLASTFAAGSAAADSTLTSTLSFFTFETSGTTYGGAVASTLAGEFDFSNDLYATATMTYITAGGTDAVAFGAGAGYRFINTLDAARGVGTDVGAAIHLGGMVEANAKSAVSQDLIVDASLSTPINNFGSLWSYSVGAEYVPWGIYANYISASYSDYDVSVDGFGVGYRTRF